MNSIPQLKTLKWKENSFKAPTLIGIQLSLIELL